MKKRERKALGRYVRSIADEMGLRDWTIDLEIGEPAVEGWGASCAPTEGRKVATLTFTPSRRDDPIEELRATVVHELIHCHFFGIWDMARRDTLEALGQSTYDMFIAGFERHMEYGVDAMAEALAPHMPLIDWDEK